MGKLNLHKQLFRNTLYCKTDKKTFVQIFMLKSILILVSIIVPYLFSGFVQFVLIDQIWKYIYIIFLLYAATFMISWLTKYRLTFISKQLLNRIHLNVKKSVLRKYYKLTYVEEKKIDKGEIKSILDIDSEKVATLISEKWPDLFFNTLASILIILILYIILPSMTIIVLAFTFFMCLIDYRLSLKLKTHNREMIDMDSAVHKFITNTLFKWYDISNYNLFQYINAKFNSLISKHIEVMNRWVVIWETKNIYLDFKNYILQYVIVYCFGGYLALNRIISFGELILYAQLFALFYSFLDSSIVSYIWIMEAMSNYERILSILDYEEKESKQIWCGKVNENGLSVNNLHFNYEDGTMIFDDFSCTFPRNSISVITGSNGIGKTTLVEIILGILQPQDGQISYDLVAGETDNHKSARFSSYLKSDTLYNICLRDNLLLDKKKEKQLIELLKYFDLLNRLNMLPGFLDYKVKDYGEEFSGGELQRLLIIRTILSDADILMFDEPTSALDSIQKEKFVKLLRVIKQKKIIIIISHDPNVIASGDQKIHITRSIGDYD